MRVRVRVRVNSGAVYCPPCRLSRSGKTRRLEAEIRVRVKGGEVRWGVLGDRQAVKTGHDEALGGGDQAEEADHREAAVVDLRDEGLLLALGRELLGEAEGVPQVEGHRVRVAALDCSSPDSDAE